MTPAVLSIEGAKVKELSEANETAHSIRKWLCDRKRNTPITDLPRTKMEILRKGGTINDEQFMEYFKGLDRLGIGTFFKGRGINPDTFTWKYSLKIIAEAARTGVMPDLSAHKQMAKNKEEKKAAPPTKKRITVVAKPVRRRTEKADINVRTVHVHLRPGFMVELNVPVDFSKSEAEQICQSVSRLAQ